MRLLFQLLAPCILMLVVTSANAQMAYTATGGNALIPEVVSTMELGDGNMLVKSMSHGFTWTNGESVVGGNGSLECFGSSIVSAEGDQLDGSGTCEGMDEEGDVWWIWYSGGMGGDFGFLGGSGKYAGISGGGTWKGSAQYPDGKTNNEWEGTWTIPAMEMTKPDMQ